MELVINNLPWFVLFVGVLLFVESIFYLVQDWREGESRTVNRRMRLLQSGRDKHQVLKRLLRSQQDPLSRHIAQTAPALDRLVAQSGISITLARATLWSTAAVLLGILVGANLLFLPLYQAVLFGLVAGAGLPALFLKLKGLARIRRFQEQLPETLNLMVRSLRAGHPVAVTIGTVAREMEDPAGTEFGLAVDEMTYGLSLHEALENISRRIPLDDLKFITAAIQIQHQVGGNLAELLSNIEVVIRDRFRMFAKIRAVSAEGRMSGWVIGALPLVVWGALSLLRPGYYGEVAEDPLFNMLIGIAVGLWICGQIAICRMVNFKF